MTNPFEDTDAGYHVLTNEEGQCALWPDYLEVPDGWFVACGPASRQACLDYVDSHWRDLRPGALTDAGDRAHEPDREG